MGEFSADKYVSAGDDASRGGGAMSHFKISKIRLQDATENPSFWVYSIRRMAPPVSICLGHFFPLGFPPVMLSL
jgi:hypothetical protein